MAIANNVFIILYAISVVLFIISVFLRCIYNDFPSYLSYGILVQETFIQLSVIGIAVPLTMDRSNYKYAESDQKGQDDGDIIVDNSDVVFSFDRRRSKRDSQLLFVDPGALFSKDDVLTAGVNPMKERKG
jgi:hypothetical protein